MSLAKMLAGRRRESYVWHYFNYCEETQKSMCMVVDEKTGKSCGMALAGKNSSNLVNHLSRAHKFAHEEYKQKEQKKAIDKLGVKSSAGNTCQSSKKSQSLEQCMKRNVVTWQKDSVEHKQCLQ
jgi:hypothetical protein